MYVAITDLPCCRHLGAGPGEPISCLEQKCSEQTLSRSWLWGQYILVTNVGRTLPMYLLEFLFFMVHHQYLKNWTMYW